MKVAAVIAAELYDPDRPRSFKEDLEAHLLHGYVFSGPEWFLLGRPVVSTADIELINDPWYVFPGPHDCWYVHAYADTRSNNFVGLVEKVLRYMPYALPLVAWTRQRDERLRVYPIRKFITWTHKLTTPR